MSLGNDKHSLYMKLLRCVPNTLTLCNSLCGYIAILITLQAYKAQNIKDMITSFVWSACMILFAMIFDMFDGFSARKLKVSSDYGIQMDSLADMTTFGVAPAVIVAVMAHNIRHIERTGQFIPICIFCAIYLGCAALRLATYNIKAMSGEHGDPKYFTGLPSPGAASAICSFILFFATKHDRHNILVFQYLPIYAAFVGILMVSQVPYLHFGRWITSAIHSKNKIIIIVIALFFWLFTGVTLNPFLFPFIVINGYVVIGIVSYFATKMGFFDTNESINHKKSVSKEEK